MPTVFEYLYGSWERRYRRRATEHTPSETVWVETSATSIDPPTAVDDTRYHYVYDTTTYVYPSASSSFNQGEYFDWPTYYRGVCHSNLGQPAPIPPKLVIKEVRDIHG